MSIYNFFDWITSCPYFIFLSSISGIFSLIGVLFLLRKYKKPKPILNYVNSNLFIDQLCFLIEHKSIQWFPVGFDDLEKIAYLNSNNVDLTSSFMAFGTFDTQNTAVILVKESNIFYLFGCIDIMTSSFRLLMTSKSNPNLKRLASKLTKLDDLTNEEFSKALFRNFQQRK